MFERIDREADGEVYVNEVLDFLHSMADDLDQERFILTVSPVKLLLHAFLKRDRDHLTVIESRWAGGWWYEVTTKSFDSMSGVNDLQMNSEFTPQEGQYS